MHYRPKRGYGPMSENKGGGGGPCHTYTEILDEFNLTKGQFESLRNAHPGFPERKLRVASTCAQGRTYYNIREARAWFKSLKDRGIV